MWEWWISFGYLVGLFERETKWKSKKQIRISLPRFLFLAVTIIRRINGVLAVGFALSAAR